MDARKQIRTDEAGRTGPQQAVILAAGMGRRIKGHIPPSPKGFIELEGEPIIRRSLGQLRAVGISNVILVTGFMRQSYEDLIPIYPGMRCVHNPRFAESGSMYSLFLAREWVSGPFLLLESDLIYEQRALTTLLSEPEEHAILISGRTNSGDEVYVDGHDGFIQNITKDRNAVRTLVGELTGLSLISTDLFQDMVGAADLRFTDTLEVSYETDILAALAPRRDVRYRLVEDLIWSEIDDPGHLRRARREIMPRIIRQDAPLPSESSP